LRISRTAARLSRRRWDQHVEDLAFMVGGTPEIHPLAGDPHHHLVQVPGAGTDAAQRVGEVCRDADVIGAGSGELY
jgi:hypothetical protein